MAALTPSTINSVFKLLLSCERNAIRLCASRVEATWRRRRAQAWSLTSRRCGRAIGCCNLTARINLAQRLLCAQNKDYADSCLRCAGLRGLVECSQFVEIHWNRLSFALCVLFSCGLETCGLWSHCRIFVKNRLLMSYKLVQHSRMYMNKRNIIKIMSST